MRLVKHNKLAMPLHNPLVVARCSERGCPFPAEEGRQYCRRCGLMQTEPRYFQGTSTLGQAEIQWQCLMSEK